MLKDDIDALGLMALRLETVIGGTADHWLRMQAAHDLARARKQAPRITRGLKRLRPA